MATYQGRALQREPRRKRGGRLRRLVHVLLGLAVLAAIAHVPWGELRREHLVVTHIDVEGLRYLGADHVREAAGLTTGTDLLGVDFARARQALLMHPRIAHAEVKRNPLRGVRVAITERVPVLLVAHGVPWELDSSGVLLEPLAQGVVADVPLLQGAGLEKMPPGTQADTPRVRRGLAWARDLAANDPQLLGKVSEIDVSDDRTTALVLMDGTRVLALRMPCSLERLAALRVVLADLQQRGIAAAEVDVRFHRQVIVRPAASDGDGGTQTT